jgi:hypothetical protein
MLSLVESKESAGQRIVLNDNEAPYAAAVAQRKSALATIAEQRKSAFEAAMASISNLAANRARHQHAAQTLPPTRQNPRAPSVREQELRRRGLPTSNEEYRIVCRGVVYHPSTSAQAKHSHAMAMYIGFRPIPVLFIFLAMVLACTTIIEFVLDTWVRYSSRIRLEGREQRLYADVATLDKPQERTGEVDVEKRAEAQES